MLGLFDAEHREWSLDEMVARLGLPRMTGYRMARTLQGAGYLVTDPVTGRYHLGPALLASIYLSEGYAQLVDIARPYLESLVETSGESATLAVEVDGVAVCVDMVASTRPLKREVAVGRVIGDTANAHGKMFAASKSDDRARRHRQPAARAAHAQDDHGPARARARAGEGQGRGRGVRPRRARPRHLCRRRPRSRPDGKGHRDAGGRRRRRAASAPMRDRACADAVKATAASLSEFFGYARSGAAVS